MWPTKESVKIDGLAIPGGHRVVVLCGGKPQQSFWFRFSESETPELCLFLNDLYKTAQLWKLRSECSGVTSPITPLGLY